MKIIYINIKELLDYESEIGVELIVKERAININSRKGLKRFYASFYHSDIRYGTCFLLGVTGNGDTVDEALADYATSISNKTLIINANSPKRKEFVVPKLIHTKLLNK